MKMHGSGEWSVCRICLNRCNNSNNINHDNNIHGRNRSSKHDGISYSLFQVSPLTSIQFHRMMMDLCPVELSADDGLPNRLCRHCADDIVNAYGLKIKCQKSQTWLERTLKQYKSHLNGSPSLSLNPKFIKQESLDDKYNNCDFEIFEDDKKYPDAISDFDHNYKKLSGYVNKAYPNDVKSEKHEDDDDDDDFKSDKSNDPDYSSDSDSSEINLKQMKIKKSRSSVEKSYVCPLCEYISKSSNNYKRHLRNHDNYKPHGCDQCPYRCTSRSKLKEHKKIHSGEKPFLCDQCHYTCRTVSNLNKHKSSKHSSERNFACDECDFKTKTKNALEVHKRRHSGDKRFVCEFCPYKAIQKARLEVHIKMVHTGERPYACDQCTYRCVDSSYLKIHLRTHCVKALSCDECGYSCHTKFKLKMHKLTHTGEKPHKCSMCDFKCSRTTLLKRHHKRIHKLELKPIEAIN